MNNATAMALAGALVLSACGTTAGPTEGKTTTAGKMKLQPAPASQAVEPPAREAPSRAAAKKEATKKETECFMCPKPVDKSAADLSAPLGSKKNPVRCFMPGGEREYLRRLRCPDGKPPVFNRMGSFGSGPYGTIIDGYKVECASTPAATVFMDMYHKKFMELKPVPGFKIDNTP